jgi:hypothetical protein
MKLQAVPLLWCALALFIGGCPKRQTPPRIVYVPSPAPAATQSTPAGEATTMVIEEPAPPEPAATTPHVGTSTPTVTPDKHGGRVRRQPAAATPENTPENTPDEAEQPAPQVPSLEPHESSAEEASLRSQIQGLQDDVRARIAKLSHAGLSGADGKTLDDARTFFQQSLQALSEADLQRALTLARKASLLVLALEH